MMVRWKATDRGFPTAPYFVSESQISKSCDVTILLVACSNWSLRVAEEVEEDEAEAQHFELLVVEGLLGALGVRHLRPRVGNSGHSNWLVGCTSSEGHSNWLVGCTSSEGVNCGGGRLSVPASA